nr:chitobiase/beta-hexosaminidase C-terminal domain-containing protein [Methanobacterium subterraneum]
MSDNTISQNLDYGINIAGINSTIFENNVTNNGNNGINANGANTTITWNNVTSNSGSGIYVNGADITVSDNTATNNQHGIYLNNSTGTIQSNDLADNQYGIYLSSSSANINFNRIAGNNVYGLYCTGNGIVNATNNWWGSNNDPSTNSSNIYNNGETLNYNPWLVLNINTNPVTTTNNSTIAVDLTHNNAGSDTSPQGNVPDNIPISFFTSLGTITNPGYTRNGKTNATFSRENVSSGAANITVALDNQSLQTNVFFDETPLAIHVNPIGGLYNRTQNVTLITIDPNGTSITYYATDGSDPLVNGIIYSNPITLNTTTILRYVAVDSEGNCGPQYTTTYIIDTTPPNATADIKGGVYNSTQTVTLTATDNIDPHPVIYYTTDGSDPTTSSTLYTSPITLQMNLTTRTIIDLKFIAVDQLGNMGLIQTETYILTLSIVNINNNKTYSLIQDAINDNSTLNGDVIQIYSGTYSETVIVTKKLTIMPVSNNDVTIQAADPNHNVFTITNSGNGSIIQYLTLNGNINLQANDCTIYMNTITGNGTSGIITSNSVNNAIIYNDITCNGFNGIQTNSSSNTIYGNTIHDCVSGIYSENSNNKISSNDLTNNLYGIWTYNSTDNIQFNRIAQNTYGLRNDIGTVNATNNWWGTNNPTNPNDIWIVSGNVNYTQWLVLSVNASSTNSGGNSSVTADLTHNNQGEDTTPQGHVPNGIPVNFTTNYGTIVTTSYTVKGKATTILNLGSTQNATVTTAASLDNQNVSTTGFISTGTAILTITSTAIDNSTGQPLNITHDMPLNNSVTWLSAVWINTGMFTDELQVIVDGIVVQDKYFYNAAYTTWQYSYSTSVFNAIIYANQHLPFISSAELTNFWNNLTTTYNLTSSELEFIQNHGQEFIDNLTVNIVYPGVAGLNLTVTDPHSNVINLNFPGNVIQRTSQVIYTGSLGEGVKSFAIATTKVTEDVMQYWWNQYSSYQTGDAMNVAYNTFLTALMIEYIHDRIADNITTPLNVTWSRTSPAIVSISEDPYQIYETLESDHSMRMTVIGTTENMRVFNFITSNSISFIEYEVMNSSATMELLYIYNNYNTYVEIFEENGFIIIKSLMNDNFLVIDPETSIVRDIDTVNNLYGGYMNGVDVQRNLGKNISL